MVPLWKILKEENMKPMSKKGMSLIKRRTLKKNARSCSSNWLGYSCINDGSNHDDVLVQPKHTHGYSLHRTPDSPLLSYPAYDLHSSKIQKLNKAMKAREVKYHQYLKSGHAHGHGASNQRLYERINIQLSC